MITDEKSSHSLLLYRHMNIQTQPRQARREEKKRTTKIREKGKFLEGEPSRGQNFHREKLFYFIQTNDKTDCPVERQAQHMCVCHQRERKETIIFMLSNTFYSNVVVVLHHLHIQFLKTKIITNRFVSIRITFEIDHRWIIFDFIVTMWRFFGKKTTYVIIGHEEKKKWIEFDFFVFVNLISNCLILILRRKIRFNQ